LFTALLEQLGLKSSASATVWTTRTKDELSHTNRNPHRQPRGPIAATPWLKILLEVVLITAGVFLGLAGESWRESREHRELAEQSLRRFREEFRLESEGRGARASDAQRPGEGPARLLQCERPPR
jgi:hypothetical protein